MGRLKTSLAEIKSMRLNPVTSPQDEQVLEIIEHWNSKGFTFKELVIDRLLRGEGIDPVKIRHPSSILTLEMMESLLSHFAEELLSKIKRGEVSVEDSESSLESSSIFTTNFARGFIERQKKGRGDSE